MCNSTYVLTLSCPNRPGIVAGVTKALFECGGDIREAHQYDDPTTSHFFMRINFTLPSPGDMQKLRDQFPAIADSCGMTWKITPSDRRLKVVLMTSRLDHCLVDILYRHRTGELDMDIVAIISNHPGSTFSHVDFGPIPFHYLPVSPDTKLQQEADVKAIIERTGADLVVLARYMQILSNDLTRHLFGRCINIHHSFLPGFKGARPYHQAHGRGVKLIGATAHYVTEDLDEGPIIEQDVERISHHDTPEDLVRKGRDIERRVLARAIRFHLEGRILLNCQKTIVFRD